MSFQVFVIAATVILLFQLVHPLNILGGCLCGGRIGCTRPHQWRAILTRGHALIYSRAYTRTPWARLPERERERELQVKSPSLREHAEGGQKVS